jgi:hypothetical protein
VVREVSGQTVGLAADVVQVEVGSLLGQGRQGAKKGYAPDETGEMVPVFPQDVGTINPRPAAVKISGPPPSIVSTTPEAEPI